MRMKLESMHDLLTDELEELYRAEQQLIRALPGLVKKATTPALKEALESHLEETEDHAIRLEEIFDLLGLAARGKPCKGMDGLLEEGSDVLAADGQDALVDAALIRAAQQVEHYEIAAYGTAIAHARVVGEDDIADILTETLEEERAADAKLNQLAKADINSRAAEVDAELD